MPGRGVDVLWGVSKKYSWWGGAQCVSQHRAARLCVCGLLGAVSADRSFFHCCGSLVFRKTKRQHEDGLSQAEATLRCTRPSSCPAKLCCAGLGWDASSVLHGSVWFGTRRAAKAAATSSWALLRRGLPPAFLGGQGTCIDINRPILTVS